MASSDEKHHHDADAQFLNSKPEQDSLELPSPVSTPAQKSSSARSAKLSTTVIIPVWIIISSSVIIYNNYLYNTLNFKFPVFLVTFHLTFAVRLLSLLIEIWNIC